MRDRLPFLFEDLGEQQVKNIARPVRIYRVRPEGRHPDPPPPAGEGNAGGARVGAAEPLPLPDKPSIAVLPFSNMSGHPEQEQKRDGDYYVRDLCSALGTVVNGEPIGHYFRTDDAPLRVGDNEVIAGGVDSPFVFSVFI